MTYYCIHKFVYSFNIVLVYNIVLKCDDHLCQYYIVIRAFDMFDMTVTITAAYIYDRKYDSKNGKIIILFLFRQL